MTLSAALKLNMNFREFGQGFVINTRCGERDSQPNLVTSEGRDDCTSNIVIYLSSVHYAVSKPKKQEDRWGATERMTEV